MTNAPRRRLQAAMTPNGFMDALKAATRLPTGSGTAPATPTSAAAPIIALVHIPSHDGANAGHALSSHLRDILGKAQVHEISSHSSAAKALATVQADLDTREISSDVQQRTRVVLFADSKNVFSALQVRCARAA